MDQTFKPAKASSYAEFLTGAKRALPIVVASTPFGLLFGAIAVDSGLSVGEAVFMSATIYAGASQLVGLDLFSQNIAPWMIVLSIVAVNFRHVLYSAAVGRRIRHFTLLQKAVAFFVLIDPQYAEVEIRGEAGIRISFPWYMGLGLTMYVFWVFQGLIGGLFGNLITDPYAFGLDFLLPIYFLGMVMSFRHRKNWVPVVIASTVCAVAAYKTVGSPWHVTLGACGGVLLAALLAKPKNEEA
ncbi:branched-chain amino acid ABC transporter permease [Falsochrobactrum shanghaiense]|uniref:Branched-chain amino acid ABC transporter permease n=1 Tax=Falsochrobactrum shanghaiense TaxID=2201899 RepID=A0A316J5Q0_9HYPH|nr:AzlC family ABC transporter permease [Falsochrobactrum shanghaiense]PWL16994.1 branched-chain amino acid ABC transporter permease [Falsochrobactrum shanghaiense]